MQSNFLNLLLIVVGVFANIYYWNLLLKVDDGNENRKSDVLDGYAIFLVGVVILGCVSIYPALAGICGLIWGGFNSSAVALLSILVIFLEFVGVYNFKK